MKRNGNKSFYRKIFGNTMLVLVIPLLLSLFLSVKTESIMYELILRSNSNSLEHYFSVLDMTFYEMGSHSSIIISNDLCREYADYAGKNKKNLSYRVMEILSLLNGFQDNRYQDLFIYYPGNGRVISGYNGSLDVDDYYSVFYKEDIANGEQFYEMLDSAQKELSLYLLKYENGENILCAIRKKAERKWHEKEFVVVEVISTEYLKKIMSGKNGIEEGISLIFGQNGKPLFSSNGNMDIKIEENHGYKRGHEMKIENTKYVLQTKEATSLEVLYAYATPLDTLMVAIKNIRYICILGNLISIFIGVIVVYRISKRTYSPLKRIISKIEDYEMTSYDSKKNTELEFVEMIFKQISEEGGKKKEIIEMKRNKFINSLLLGDIEMKDDIDDIFEKNSVKICSDKFKVAIIQIDKSIDFMDGTREFILKNVYEELCDRQNIGYFFKMERMKYGVLINVKKDSSPTEESALWEEGIEFLKENVGIMVSVAVSDVCTGMNQISKSYEEAQIALRYVYLFGTGSCVYYNQIKDRKFDYRMSMESKLFLDIVDYIKDFNCEKNEKEFTEQIFEQNGINRNTSMDVVDCFRFEMVSIINKILIDREGYKDTRVEKIEEVLRVSNLSEFKDKFIELIASLRQEERKKVNNKIDGEKVKKYIKENYKNSSISVVMIGEVLGVSPVEMSKVFRERYHSSIPDYISAVRVINSKEDLKNTNKSIKMVAEENGFLSSTVFIAAFKKIEGLTPGKYRDLYRK